MSYKKIICHTKGRACKFHCIPDDRPIKIKLAPYLIYSACVQCQLLSLCLFSFFFAVVFSIRIKRRKNRKNVYRQNWKRKFVFVAVLILGTGALGL